ncbi:methyl-accepting chemotaxis protein [Marinobacter mangrovi]|uniref:methyl-accepting chemotaxis protein n=1 Tax=Marinobacter mangrovi TaxID=2803918 RepID=UPI0019334950|nr:methyl-accepting chemotaxis protein [Marinobacter mangrovi]
MKLSLSWRQKFLALIVVTPLGFLAVGAAIYWGITSVSSSYRTTYDLVSYQNQASELLSDWNSIEKDLASFKEGGQAAAKQKLEAFKADAEALRRRAEALGDDDIASSADEIASAAGHYVAQRQDWITDVSALGLNDQSGMRKALSDAFQGLKDLQLSLFDESVAEVSRTQKGFFADRDMSFAKPAEHAVKGLELMVKQYDWQESVVGKAVTTYRAAFDKAAAKMKDISATDTAAVAAGNQLQKAIRAQDEALQNGPIAAAIEQASSVESSAKMVSLGALVIFAPILVLILFIISRTLVNRLQGVMEMLQRVSDGDLTRKLDVGRNDKDEFNRLATATNQMIDNINRLMRDSIESTNNLIEVRGELDKSMERLARNSEAVESQTVQAATASQQISVTLTDVAERTSQVGVSTQKANESAQSGARVVDESVNAMQRLSNLIQDTHSGVQSLNQSCTKVTGIIDVINGLAEQTNLLALNAAIEAARAGEAGRGFSVVADEVRTLASKTVEATDNITRIIDELNKQTANMDSLTQHGLKLARESEESAGQIAGAMGTVTESIQTLNAEMDQVVVAVEEISTTTDDIAQKMEEIRQQSSETQAIGSELGTQNQRLSEYADRLSSSTRRFTV